MNFFVQDIICENGNTWRQNKYKSIIEEQVLISYISQSLSFIDTDSMCPYDRQIVLETLKQIKEEEQKRLDEIK